jgi:hypothetical protein
VAGIKSPKMDDVTPFEVPIDELRVSRHIQDKPLIEKKKPNKRLISNYSQESSSVAEFFEDKL